MRSLTLLPSLTSLLAGAASALGINCRGSGLCPLATWDNQSPLPVMQILRDALYQSKAPDSTPYNGGDHVICVSNTLTINLSLPIIDPTGLTSGSALGSWHLGGKIKDGGICLFPQGLKNGPLTLGMIRKLVDKLLEHGCETCGSVPIHFVDQGSNDPDDGILTFNYVRHPYCTENCLTDGLVANSNATTAAAAAAEKPKIARRMLASAPSGTATAVRNNSPEAALLRRDVPVAVGIPGTAAQSDSPKAAFIERSLNATLARRIINDTLSERSLSTTLAERSINVTLAERSINATLAGRSIRATVTDERGSWNGTATTTDVEKQRALKRQTNVEKQRAARRNAILSPFQAHSAEGKATGNEKRATRENAQKKRAVAGIAEQKKDLSSSSAKFADLAPRRNEGPRGNKGWVGWLRT